MFWLDGVSAVVSSLSHIRRWTDAKVGPKLSILRGISLLGVFSSGAVYNVSSFVRMSKIK